MWCGLRGSGSSREERNREVLILQTGEGERSVVVHRAIFGFLRGIGDQLLLLGVVANEGLMAGWTGNRQISKSTVPFDQLLVGQRQA